MKIHPAIMLSAALCSLSLAAETKIKIQDLPPAVQTAMKQQTKGATILGASSERENGRMTFEVETMVAGRTRDLTFNASGTLLEEEQEILIDRLPTAARQAIQAKAAGGEIKKIESVTRGTAVSYEATIMTAGGKELEWAVNSDGRSHK